MLIRRNIAAFDQPKGIPRIRRGDKERNLVFAFLANGPQGIIELSKGIVGSYVGNAGGVRIEPVGSFLGHAAHFTDVSGISYPNNKANQISGDQLTVISWVQINPSDSGNKTVCSATTDNTESYRIVTEVATPLRSRFRLFTGGSSTNLDTDPDAFPQDSKLHQFACRYDGATMEIFIDGKSIVSTAKTGNIDPSTTAFIVGNADPTNQAWHAGNIEQVRVYDIALDNDYIRNDFLNRFDWLQPETVQVFVSEGAGEVTKSPSKGLLSFQGNAVGSFTQIGLSVSKGILTFNGNSPTVSSEILETRSPTKGLLSFNGNSVGFDVQQTRSLSRGLLSFVGNSPTVSGDDQVVITPQKGLLTFNGNSVVEFTNIDESPSKGILSFKGNSVNFSVEEIRTLTKGLFTFNGNAVGFKVDQTRSPTKGLLRFKGSSVSFDSQKIRTLSRGLLSFKGNTVNFQKTGPQTITPTSGIFTLKGNSVQFNVQAWSSVPAVVSNWSAIEGPTSSWNLIRGPG